VTDAGGWRWLVRFGLLALVAGGLTWALPPSPWAVAAVAFVAGGAAAVSFGLRAISWVLLLACILGALRPDHPWWILASLAAGVIGASADVERHERALGDASPRGVAYAVTRWRVLATTALILGGVLWLVAGAP
jgi:hypothetical protein